MKKTSSGTYSRVSSIKQTVGKKEDNLVRMVPPSQLPVLSWLQTSLEVKGNYKCKAKPSQSSPRRCSSHLCWGCSPGTQQGSSVPAATTVPGQHIAAAGTPNSWGWGQLKPASCCPIWAICSYFRLKRNIWIFWCASDLFLRSRRLFWFQLDF